MRCTSRSGSSLQQQTLWSCSRRLRHVQRPHLLSTCGASRIGGSAGPLRTLESDAKPISEFGFSKEFADRYELGPLLGSGSFGVVHVAVDRKTQQRYAVKTITKRFLGSYLEPHFVARIQHEVDVYRHMGQSLNVAHLEEAYEDDVCVDLVMELAAGGSMWQRIKRGSYSEGTAARIIRQVVQAVAQCHAKNVILRDVKPDNFLFRSTAENAPLKMVDFGLAERCAPGQVLTERAGTPFYVAPEVLQQRYSLPADVWSVGVTTYQLLAGRFPWHNDDDYREAAAEDEEAGRATSNKVLWRAIMYGQLDYEWPPWDTISGAAKDFVQQCLQRDPSQRPTAAALLEHPWLNQERGASSSSSTTFTTTGSSSNTSSSSSSSGGLGGADSSQLQERPLDATLVQRLQRYGTYGRFKQLALRHVASAMAADDATLQGLAQEFRQLDTDGTGRIAYDKVVGLLKGGRYDLSEVEVRMLMTQFDLNADGTVDYYEWAAALLDWSSAERSKKWVDWLRQVFDRFDQDGNGQISTEELHHMICEGLTEDEWCVPDAVPAILREADSDGDGQLSFEEFADLLHFSPEDTLELFPSRRMSSAGAASSAAKARQQLLKQQQQQQQGQEEQ